jgi:L-lactate dehydrogenase complex protein LldF
MIPLPTLQRAPVDHAAASAAFVADGPRTDWHDAALWHVREKRDRAAASVPEWEALRTLAAAVKDHALSRLDGYLEAFEAAATANGVTVHWARDAAEHNRIVHGLLAARGVRRVVKSKSMLTEECGLNPYLAARGVAVVDTDLGEHIVQLADEPPSHIVLPAIHKTRGEVGALFHEHLGTPEGEDDPGRLTAAARAHLRARFLEGEAAITGANFLVAETGEVVVCTNEGNADLGMHLPPLHVVCVGIEKVIPRRADLAVFLRLLARSATGQALTVYTSHLRRPRPGTEVHVVLVDDGRTEQLARPDFRASLRCIRCAACLNTCPVYRRSGGHSYGSTVPGPIGSVLTPGLDLHRYAALPFASTLCGSCAAVCPVRIPLDEMLYRWRQAVTDAGAVPRWKRALLRVAGRGLGRPRLHRLGGWLMRATLGRRAAGPPPGIAGAWGAERDLPAVPAETFRTWARRNRPARP